MHSGELECLLPVSISNEHRVSASRVYQGCIFGDFWGTLSDRFDSDPHRGCVCDIWYGLAKQVLCYDRLRGSTGGGLNPKLGRTGYLSGGYQDWVSFFSAARARQYI